MPDNNGELKIGQIYEFSNGKYQGKGVYLGKREHGKYKHVIATKGAEFIFSWLFESYTFEGNILIIGSNRFNNLSSLEEKYLEERLRGAGL
jgi:hypothetical protein